jgi:crossover junction endodeoxyribonuclease RusA
MRKGKNMIELELPWPPSVNHYKIAGKLTTTKNGKTYQPRVNSQETLRYFFEVWMKIHRLRAREGLKSFDSATISMEIYLFAPDHRKRDIDNICKVLIDSLQKAGIYKDDSQIHRLYLEKREMFRGGKVLVRIKEINET